jgi:hypothetical protein
MTPEEFTKMFDARVEALRETGRIKGKKYTVGDVDRFKNFKDLEPRVSRLVTWEVFFRKHWSAIEYFLKTGENIGEDICDTHIHDCIMYLILLEGLIKEGRNTTNDAQAYTEGDVSRYTGPVKCPICHVTSYANKTNLNISVICANCNKWVHFTPIKDYRGI